MFLTIYDKFRSDFSLLTNKNEQLRTNIFWTAFLQKQCFQRAVIKKLPNETQGQRWQSLAKCSNKVNTKFGEKIPTRLGSVAM